MLFDSSFAIVKFDTSFQQEKTIVCFNKREKEELYLYTYTYIHTHTHTHTHTYIYIYIYILHIYYTYIYECTCMEHHHVVLVSVICLHKTHSLHEFISTHVSFYKCKHTHVMNTYTKA